MRNAESDAQRREYQRKYYATHKEKAKEYQRQYNMTHKKSSRRLLRGGQSSDSTQPRRRLSDGVTASAILHSPNPVNMINAVLAGRTVYVSTMRRA